VSQLLYPPFLLIAIVAVAFGGYTLMATRQHTEALREEYAVTSELAVQIGAEKSAEVDALKARVGELNSQVASQESRADALEKLARDFEVGKDKINGDIGEIHSMPAGVSVTNVNHGGSVVNISGFGASEEAVFTYARQLRSSGRFKLVVLSSLWSEGVACGFDMVLYK
jgi:Tfp pilus assembly protein PilN